VGVADRTKPFSNIRQRWFRKNYDKEATTRAYTYKWHKSFVETSCICAKNNNSGRRPSDESVENVRALLLYAPQKSTRRANK
jgi:hypothetical protein